MRDDLRQFLKVFARNIAILVALPFALFLAGGVIVLVSLWPWILVEWYLTGGFDLSTQSPEAATISTVLWWLVVGCAYVSWSQVRNSPDTECQEGDRA